MFGTSLCTMCCTIGAFTRARISITGSAPRAASLRAPAVQLWRDHSFLGSCVRHRIWSAATQPPHRSLTSAARGLGRKLLRPSLRRHFFGLLCRRKRILGKQEPRFRHQQERPSIPRIGLLLRQPHTLRGKPLEMSGVQHFWGKTWSRPKFQLNPLADAIF